MRTMAVGLAAVAGIAAAVVAISPGVSAKEPSIDMQAVVKAAQIDPQRPGQTSTPGAEADVKVVEQALHDEGLLDATWVDGSFGTKTVDAYRAYQESLGYQGIDANGLPGKTSLAKLGDERFTVTNTITPGKRVSYGDQTVNARTKAMLDETSKKLGRKLVLDQGSYNPGGDPTSAGTHDGGGVVDISVSGMSTSERTKATKVLRTVGFAAWLRNPSQGDWPYHIHAVAINDSDLAGQAQEQVGDYYLGKNGLADEGPDDGPSVKPIRTWEDYREQA